MIQLFSELYSRSFEHLHELSAIRQWFTDAEFSHEMASEKVIKFVGWDENGDPCSLATLSTDLMTIPWINPTYFQLKFPDHYARSAIYYISALMVRPDLQGGHWTRAMIHEIALFLTKNQAMTAFDCCSHNVTEVGLPDLVIALAREVVDVEIEELDSQHYYALHVSNLGETIIDLRETDEDHVYLESVQPRVDI